MAFAVRSSLDVVFWFMDRALNDREYIQPQKLHRLLYLAQSYFPLAAPGKKLMPATFVTDNFGPVEPTIFHAFACGRPHMVEANPISDQVNDYLDGIWRRFGQYSADALSKKVAQFLPVADAMAKGVGEEIPYTEMVKFVILQAKVKAQGQGAGTGAIASSAPPVKPRLMRSQTGKAVAVQAWAPKAATPKKD